MKYLRDIIYLVIIIIILFIAKSWIKDKVITSLGGYTNKEVKSKIDSVHIKGKIDTLAIFTEYIKNHNIKINQDAIIKYKYKYKNPVTKKEEILDSVQKYTANITDSIIKGTATVTNSNKGKLLNLDLNYIPLVPKLIKQTDTIYKTINNTITLSNKKSKIGIGLGYNNLQFLTLSGSYTTKKNLQFIGTYGKSLQETTNIVNGVPFTFTPKDYYGLTIIKNW